MYNDIQNILEKAIKSYSGKRPKITFIEEDYQVDMQCLNLKKMDLKHLIINKHV